MLWQAGEMSSAVFTRLKSVAFENFLTSRSSRKAMNFDWSFVA